MRQKSVDDANRVGGFVSGGASSRRKAFDFVNEDADEHARVLDHLLDLLEPGILLHFWVSETDNSGTRLMR